MASPLKGERRMWDLGPLRCMGVLEGWVMARRPSFTPMVLSLTAWGKLPLLPALTSDPPKPRERRRDLCFEALAAIHGAQLSEITATLGATIGKSLAEIRKVCPAVTPEALQTRAATYRRKHPLWDLTAPALAKHWAELGNGAQPISNPYRAQLQHELDTITALAPCADPAVMAERRAKAEQIRRRLETLSP